MNNPPGPIVFDTDDHSKLMDFIKNSPKLRPDDFKVNDLKWKFAVRSILRGENVLLLGESGCGKTRMAMELSMALGRKIHYFNMGATQDPRSTLIGNTHFKKEEGTYVAESEFIRAIQEENTMILLDELSRAHPDAHNILMTALDKLQRYVRIDERPDTPTIKVAKGVTFLATANVGSQYTSTRTMDRALLDRFSIVIMEPISKEEEVDLMSKAYPNLDGHTINAIAEIAETTRKQVKADSPRINTIVSTRVTMRMAALCSDGFTLVEAAETEIYPFYSDAGGVDSERSYILKEVQRHVPEARTKDKATPYTPSISKNDLNKGADKPW
jgi:midasin (ATPase involved in ribosome maturation)